jgi:hypothetical protein
VQAQPVSAQTPPKKKGGITATRAVLWLVLLGVVFVFFKMKSGSSLAGAVAGPQTIVSETISLKEGQAMGYGFRIPSDRRIEVNVTANPKPVNVMLMSEAQWKKYNDVRGKLFGGQYEYKQALSKEAVLQMKESDILPAGSYRIVVERPAEALIFKKETAASVSIIGY